MKRNRYQKDNQTLKNKYANESLILEAHRVLPSACFHFLHTEKHRYCSEYFMWIFKDNVLKSIRYMLRYVIYPIYMSNACILHMNKYANNIYVSM